MLKRMGTHKEQRSTQERVSARGLLSNGWKGVTNSIDGQVSPLQRGEDRKACIMHQHVKHDSQPTFARAGTRLSLG